jgi:hypothetical protein
VSCAIAVVIKKKEKMLSKKYFILMYAIKG